jgi:hypothetical protein
VKIDVAAERCVNVLLDLIGTRVSYVVQEAVVVMKVCLFFPSVCPLIPCAPQDIFRKYPSTYEGVIPTLCANLDELDEPEAKASLIWIIGEHADKIDNAADLLGVFVDSFIEESHSVQLQTLTAVVKLFLKKPEAAQGVVQRVLDTATKDCDSPDVRDRAYIYWRLLSTDPGAAKAVVLAHRPPISIPRTTVAPGLLEELLGEISSLASVYHKPEETFVGRGRVGADSVRRGGENESVQLFPSIPAYFLTRQRSDAFSTQKALQTVAQGQQAENLLYAISFTHISSILTSLQRLRRRANGWRGAFGAGGDGDAGAAAAGSAQARERAVGEPTGRPRVDLWRRGHGLWCWPDGGIVRSTTDAGASTGAVTAPWRVASVCNVVAAASATGQAAAAAGGFTGTVLRRMIIYRARGVII